MMVAAYAAPALPLAAMYFPVYVFLAEFYATAHGLPLASIGAVFIAARLFDAVSDPFAGIVSDRWTTRWGRRRPWLAAGAPLVMLSAWMLFIPSAGVGLASFTLWLFLLTFGWTMMLTPYFAWGAELTGDYAERGRVSVWRDTAGLVGTILAAVLYSLGAGAAEGMRNVAVLIILAMPHCLHPLSRPRSRTAQFRPGSREPRLARPHPHRRAALWPADTSVLRQQRFECPAGGSVPVLRRPTPWGSGVGRAAANRLFRCRGACGAAMALAGPAVPQT